jgi:hypothetical protein
MTDKIASGFMNDYNSLQNMVTTIDGFKIMRICL